jgi:hypothetical protein
MKIIKMSTLHLATNVFNAERVYDEILEMLAQNPNQSPNFPVHDPRTFLINYSSRMKQLDDILDRLGTKQMCAKECVYAPIGCCNDNYHETLDLPEFLQIQEVEARRNGWEKNWNENLKKVCKYHSGAGCKLVLFKSPICIGFFCREIKEKLAKRFGEMKKELFLSNCWGIQTENVKIVMRTTSAEDYLISSSNVLNKMDSTIAVGRSLLEKI